MGHSPCLRVPPPSLPAVIASEILNIRQHFWHFYHGKSASGRGEGFSRLRSSCRMCTTSHAKSRLVPRQQSTHEGRSAAHTIMSHGTVRRQAMQIKESLLVQHDRARTILGIFTSVLTVARDALKIARGAGSKTGGGGVGGEREGASAAGRRFELIVSDTFEEAFDCSTDHNHMRGSQEGLMGLNWQRYIDIEDAACEFSKAAFPLDDSERLRHKHAMNKSKLGHVRLSFEERAHGVWKGSIMSQIHSQSIVAADDDSFKEQGGEEEGEEGSRIPPPTITQIETWHRVIASLLKREITASLT